MLLTPAFWPGEFHGQRSLVGYSPWGHKESDTTEQLSKKNKTRKKKELELLVVVNCGQVNTWGS